MTEITADWVRQLIRDHEQGRPRTQQTHLGISEVGNPCPRRIIHTLQRTPRVNRGDPLAAWIGTAVHVALAEAIRRDREWLTEIPVHIPGYDLPGTVDAWHPRLGIVLDWKVVGESTLRTVRTQGPGDQYRTQLHLYALALQSIGGAAHRVVIAFIPRSGRLANVHLWEEPYQDQVAEHGLARLESLRALAAHPQGAALAPPVPAHCTYCPWWQPSATDLTRACPGSPPVSSPPGSLIEALHPHTKGPSS